jgi:hypothetical protein
LVAGCDELAADALVLVGWKDGHWSEAGAYDFVVDGKRAVEDVADDLIFDDGDEGERNGTISAEGVSDLAFLRLAEGQIVDFADGGDVGRLLGADLDLHGGICFQLRITIS